MSKFIFEQFFETLKSQPGGLELVKFIEARKFFAWKNYSRNEDVAYSKMHKRVKPSIKTPHYNAQKACLLSKGGWKYYEGYIIKEKFGIPIKYAWNVVGHKIKDLTLNKKTKKQEYLEHTNIYYCGARIPIEFIDKKSVLKLKENKSLIKKYMRESNPEN